MNLTVSYNVSAPTLSSFKRFIESIPVGACWFVGYLGHLPQLSGEKTEDGQILTRVGAYYSKKLEVKKYWDLYHNKENKYTQKLLRTINTVLDDKGLGISRLNEQGQVEF